MDNPAIVYENLNKNIKSLLESDNKNKKDLLHLTHHYILLAEIFQNNKFKVVNCLEKACDIITNTKAFPTKEMSLKYFTLLSHIFLEKNMFHNFLNCLHRMHLFTKINIDRKMMDFISKIGKICEYKRECDFKFFVSLSILKGSEVVEYFERFFDEEISESGFEYEFDFHFYDRIRFNCEIDNFDIKFLSFLKSNNFNFVIKDQKLMIINHEEISLTIRVYNLMEEMKGKQEKNIVKERQRIEEIKKLKMIQQLKLEDDVKKKEIKKEETKKKRVLPKKKIIRKRNDYFRRQYNIFRICSKKIYNFINDEDDYFFEQRSNIYNNEYQLLKNETDVTNTIIESNKDNIKLLFSLLDEKLKKVKDERRESETIEISTQSNVDDAWRRGGKVSTGNDSDIYTPMILRNEIDAKSKNISSADSSVIIRGSKLFTEKQITEIDQDMMKGTESSGFSRGSRLSIQNNNAGDVEEKYQLKSSKTSENVVEEAFKINRGSRLGVVNSAIKTQKEVITNYYKTEKEETIRNELSKGRNRFDGVRNIVSEENPYSTDDTKSWTRGKSIESKPLLNSDDKYNVPSNLLDKNLSDKQEKGDEKMSNLNKFSRGNKLRKL